MTNEERDIIANFIARVGGAQQRPAQSPWGGGSVPAAGQPAPPPLPPVDREADAFIGEMLNRYPEARYRLTQLAFVQEHALAEAQNRIQALQNALQQAQAQPQQQPGGGGFFSGLFGGGQRQAPPQPPPGAAWNQGPQAQYAPPPPQYAPAYQPGMFQRGGSGFLGSALTTAAGVAGGVVLGNALMSMFSPAHGMGGGFGGGWGGWGAPMGGGPWGSGAPMTPMPDQGYVDQGTWDTGGGAAAPDQGYVDQGSWDQQDPSGGGGGWDNSGGGMDDGGFDSGGGGTDDSLA
jgi:hypothetical protein